MTPQDVNFFQVLAALFTLSFMVLIFIILRFMQGLEDSRNKLLSLAASFQEKVDPILSDLRAGAAEFRGVGERVRTSADQVGQLGDQLYRLTSFTRTGVKGALAILAQAAGSFLKH